MSDEQLEAWREAAPPGSVAEEIAAEALRLRAELRRLREALRPLALAARQFDTPARGCAGSPVPWEDSDSYCAWVEDEPGITIGLLRKAREVLGDA